MENKKLQEAIQHMEEHGFAQFKGKDAMENSVALEEHFKAKGKTLYQTSFEGTDFSYYDPHHPENKGTRYSAEYLSKNGYDFAQGGTTNYVGGGRIFTVSEFKFKQTRGKKNIYVHGFAPKQKQPFVFRIFPIDTPHDEIKEWAQKKVNLSLSNPDFMKAEGGRPLSALARDRKYTSQEEWEKAYTPHRKSKIMRYKTKEEGGRASEEIRISAKVGDDEIYIFVTPNENGFWLESEDDGGNDFTITPAFDEEPKSEDELKEMLEDDDQVWTGAVDNQIRAAIQGADMVTMGLQGWTTSFKEYKKTGKLTLQCTFECFVSKENYDKMTKEILALGGRPRGGIHIISGGKKFEFVLALIPDAIKVSGYVDKETLPFVGTNFPSGTPSTEIIEWAKDKADKYNSGSLARGGRPRSAIMRDRYNTNASEPWEVNYKRKTRARNRAEGGSAGTRRYLAEVGDEQITVIKDGKEVTGVPVYASVTGYAPVTVDVFPVKDDAIAKANELQESNDFARGGRPKSAIMRDRYNTNASEPWEVNYKRKTRARNRAEGGSAGITNQYAGKTPQQVWDAWTTEQRAHFLKDHDLAVFATAHLVKYKFIDDMIKEKLREHITEGQYNHGGKAGDGRYWVGIPKEPDKVWDAWTKGQREHFIEDHFNSASYRNSDKTKHPLYDSLIKFISKKFAEIPDAPVKSALEAAIYNHIQHPQYNYGGEVDEEIETYEPDWENDDFIEDKPRGGYDTSHAGKYLGNFETTTEALAALEVERNKGAGYFPTIWFVSDHGNYWAIDENGNEIKAAGGALGGGVVPFFQSLDMSKLPPNIRSVVEPVAQHKEIIYVREGDSSFEKFLTLKNLLETKFPDAIKKPEAPKPAAPKKPDVNVLKTRLLLINEMMKKADASKKSILKTRASIVREMIANVGKKVEGGNLEKGGSVVGDVNSIMSHIKKHRGKNQEYTVNDVLNYGLGDEVYADVNFLKKAGIEYKSSKNSAWGYLKSDEDIKKLLVFLMQEDGYLARS